MDEPTNLVSVDRPRDDVLAGVGLGAFIGLAVGLSSSPVVSVIVTAIGGILASVVGLRTTDGPFGLRPLRVATLGLSASACLLVGLLLRAHDSLSPSAASEVESWEAAGFSRRDALALTAARRTDGSYEILSATPREQVKGLMQAGMSRAAALNRVVSGGASAGVTRDAQDKSAAKSTNSVLFAGPVPDAFCGELAQKTHYEPSEALRVWRDRGGAWRSAADLVGEAVPADRQKDALERIRALACRKDEDDAQFDVARSATGDAE